MKLQIAALAAVLGLAAAGSASAQEQMGKLRAACAADAMKYCAGKAQGPERRQCMMANKDKFSPDCQAALNAAMERMKAMQGDKMGADKPH